MLKRVLVLALLVGAVQFIGISGAAAQSVAILTYNNHCLIPDSNRNIRVFNCSDGGVRYTLNRGTIRTADNLCFDHGIPLGQNSGDRTVKLVRCHGGKSQEWWVTRSGLIQNAVNWEVCLNIKGGSDSPGGELIVWPCGFNNPATNERFFTGGTINSSQFAGLPPQVQNALRQGNSITFNNGTRMVAAGAGNMVAAGAGNMVAAGGGNIVPTAGGNMVAAGSLNLIGNDGSTIANRLVGNDGGSLRGVGFRMH
jgi:hypothetical protein